MAYASWSVVFGEQPSAAKWNILGTNDASFNDGTGFGAGVITSETLNATIAFHAYRNAAKNISTTLIDVVHDTERYDYGSDFNTTTGVFTAPVAGLYHFDTCFAAGTSTARRIIQFVCSTAGTFIVGDVEATNNRKIAGSLNIDLVLNETVKVQGYNSTSLDVAGTDTWFSGFFVGV